LTYTCPKPMLPLAGKPVLQHIVELLVGHGFDEIIIATNYLRERVESHFGDGSRFGVKLIYPREEEPLGTAGAVKNVGRLLDDTFAVIQGDNITDMNLREALEFHKEKGGIATIALIHVDNPKDYGIAELNHECRVVRFREKPRAEECFSPLANTGLYILQPGVLDHIPNNCMYDFSNDLFPKLLRLNEEIYGFEVKGFWIDVGRPENYLRANYWILSKLADPHIAESAEIRGGIVNGPVTIEENVIIKGGARVTGPAIIREGSVIQPDTSIMPNTVLCRRVDIGRKSRVVGSIIYENTLIGEGSSIDQSIIGEGCMIGSETLFGRGSIIGAHCRIGDDVEVRPGARVWPGIEIESNSVISGILRRYSAL
ncbi:MAG: sugar phosphate nucleotidyltransferase, partial [Candidatus Bathyarchaeia archaeon]